MISDVHMIFVWMCLHQFKWLQADQTCAVFISIWPHLDNSHDFRMAIFGEFTQFIHDHVWTIHIISIWHIWAINIISEGLFEQFIESQYDQIWTVHTILVWPYLDSSHNFSVTIYGQFTQFHYDHIWTVHTISLWPYFDSSENVSMTIFGQFTQF